MLGVVVAFRDEVNDYLKSGDFRVVTEDEHLRFFRSNTDNDVVVVVGAIGKEWAQEATSQLVKVYRPDLVVSAGFAGGAKEGQKTGDLFLCDRLMSVEGPAALWGPDQVNEIVLSGSAIVTKILEDERKGIYGGYEFGGCLSVPQMISNVSMKKWIGENFPVSVIDMESYWVSDAISEFNIPHLVVRCVLDPVNQALPSFVGEAVQGDAGRMWGNAVRYIAKNPKETPRLIHLASQAKTARASLSGFLASIISSAL